MPRGGKDLSYGFGVLVSLLICGTCLMISSQVALHLCVLPSDQRDVENGLGQGVVLSGFLFNILINGLEGDIKRVCHGVKGGSCPMLHDCNF